MALDKRDIVPTSLVLHLMLTFVAWSVIYWRGIVRGESFPLNTFLPAPVTRFGDFFGNHYHWRTFQFDDVSYAGAYFPAIYLFVNLLVAYVASPVLALQIYLSVFGIAVIALISKWGVYAKTSVASFLTVVILFATSYPMLFMLHTGNLEGLVFVSILSAVVFREIGWLNKAYVMLGLAISMKFYPVVFVPFVISGMAIRERLQEVLRILSYSVFFTFIALAILPRGLSDGFEVIGNILESQDLYKELMVVGDPGTNFGHSFLNGVHALLGSSVLPSSRFWIPMTLLLAIHTILLIGFSDRIASRAHLLTLCAISGCLFAPTSTDYKLLYFLPIIPLVMFQRSGPSYSGHGVLLLVILIIAPKPWWVLPRSDYYNAGVWFTPLMMIGLLVAIWIIALGKLRIVRRIT